MTHANREIPSEEIETSVCRIIPNFINLYIWYSRRNTDWNELLWIRNR
jgi:hypothetical protein